jgi:UDP-2-acetamido-3-amino-2,3-dideoxy-glucuronate N-acetyltransferase
MINKYKFNKVFIHESSLVDENVQIGENTNIWQFSKILKNTIIGNNCNFGQNVCIGPNVIIGKEVRIQNNVSVYEGVTLEDEVFCGPSCVFTNDKNPRTSNNRNKDRWLKTLVKKGATLGANCTIISGITVGSYALIGAGAVITKDVPAYALIIGVPGKQIGWVSKHGQKLDLPLKGNAQATCKFSNQKYHLENNEIKLIT